MPIKVLKQRPRIPRTLNNIFAPIPSGTNKELQVINFGSKEGNPFKHIAKSIINKYGNDVHFQNTIIVLGFYTSSAPDFTTFKKSNPFKKIIVCQFEQISSAGSLWWDENSADTMVVERTKKIKDWLFGCDLIWEYDLNNIYFLKEKNLGGKVIFKPIEFSETFIYPDYDVIFYGSINRNRLELLKLVAKKYSLCCIGVVSYLTNEDVKAAGINLLPPKHDEDLFGYIHRSKIVLNLHYYSLQEQVRISELLANGKTVISEKSPVNYFGDLIQEFETPEEMMEKIKNTLKLSDDKSKEIAQRFKNGDYEKLNKYTIAYTSFTDGYDVPRNDIIKVQPDLNFPNPANSVHVTKWRYWDYGISSSFNIWVDGSIYLLRPEQYYIDLLGDFDICLFQHPWRNCIYEEIKETARINYENEALANSVIAKLEKDGYPKNNGLAETGVLIRKDSELMRRFCAEVWKEIKNGSHRDQFYFNYVLSKFPELKVKYLPPSVRTHEAFNMIGHLKHYSPVNK